LAIERGNDKETKGDLIGRVIALIGLLKQQGKGKGDGRNRGRGGGPAKQRRRTRKEGGRKLTGGTQSSARAKKRKEREMAWAGAERGWWAGRPAGPKGKEGFLCFFLFQTFSNSKFSFQIQTKFFQTFHKNFINFFRSHTSNQKLCKVK
jgi:hypothetical protein